MSNVSKSALTQLAAIIPYGAHNYIAKEMGYSSHFVLKSLLTGRIKISIEKFELIKSHYEYWKKYVDFTYANPNGVFDLFQTAKYYKELNNLINSEEYSLLNDYQRTAIVDEQKRICNQLINNRKNE